jgi:molybdopterin/thiamine biosynthesis adenylyltransferase
LLFTGRSAPEQLCYNDFEQYQLLSHDLGAAILRVVEDATQTLDRIAEPASVIEDSRKDFPRLWTSSFQSVYIDSIPAKEPALCRTAAARDAQGKLSVFVSQDPQALALRLGSTVSQVRATLPAIVYPESGDGLYLTADGPPGDLRQVLEWLKRVSPRTFAQWHREVQQRDYYQGQTAYHFFVTRGQVVGFHVDYPNDARRVRGARGVREVFARTVYQQPLPVLRLHAERVDDDYLVRRNLPVDRDDLRGRRILLVGAGAVGGFLAQALVQIGAGLPALHNEPGLLTICDRDHLSAGNIGRHLLGLKDLGRPKAVALCEHLRQWHPGCQVAPIFEDFRPDDPCLASYDVVIDATGYETYSRWLSRRCRESGWLAEGRGRALLQIWIEGRGAVVRGLLQERLSDACYECLWNHASAIEPKPRHPAYSDHNWNAHSDDGYATMTPFAVSAPLAATALAVDLLTSRGDAQPKFISRAVEASGVNRGVAKTLQRTSKCPGCATS